MKKILALCAVALAAFFQCLFLFLLRFLFGRNDSLASS